MKVARSQLEQHVSYWSEHPIHAGATWLPRGVYHFTDIQNAAAAITSGELLCREDAVARGVMKNDNASSQVIASTKPAHQNFVRLYFRPRTPTQFHNEGIRPREKRTLDAHCPVPVFFVFDLVELLSRDGVMFSNGNMAANGVEFSDSGELFSRIPFDLVYHEGPVDNALRARNVVFRRHAEVLVPKSLNLGTVRWIGCRSHAERDALLHLIGPLRAHWEPKVSIGERLFLCQGCLVESVSLESNDVVRVAFHIPRGWSVRVRFELVSETSSKSWHWKSDAFSDSSQRLTLRNSESGIMRIYIEDCLAYAGRAKLADVPF